MPLKYFVCGAGIPSKAQPSECSSGGGGGMNMATKIKGTTRKMRYLRGCIASGGGNGVGA
jgi:hypothetical protein